MSKLINMAGKKIGKLLVLKRAGKNQEGRLTWLCECECGNRKAISGKSLRKQLTKSCGCIQKECTRNMGLANALPRGVAAANVVYRVYQIKAKERNIKWNLSYQEFLNLTSKNCYYCEAIPSNCFAERRAHTGCFIYNGIDRVNNQQGYYLENCVPCCKICNSLKGAITIEMCQKILNYIYTCT